MGKKFFVVLLIPAFLVLAGYLYIRVQLQSSIKSQEKEEHKALPLKDTLGGQKLSTADLRPLLIKRLRQLLQKSSDGLYDLSIGDLQADVLASRLSLQDVVLKPDPKKASEAPGSYVEASAKALVIEGINFDDILTSRTMDYRLIKLVRPVIIIHQQKNDHKEAAGTFSHRFLKEMEKLEIKKLLIENGTIVLHKKGKHLPDSLHTVQVVMHNIILDSATRDDHDRFFFSKNATISFKNYYKRTSDGLYELKIGGGTMRVPQQQVFLQHLSYTSPLSREQFQKRQKFRNEIYHLELSSISFQNMNWWALFNGEELAADEASIEKGKLSIYLDRTLPPSSRVGNFPNQTLMKLPLRINLARLKVRKMDISYTEHNPVSAQSGTLFFDDATVNMTHVSNTRQDPQKPWTVKGSVLFMHRIPVEADFSFNRRNPAQGGFTAHIRCADEFDGSVMNSFAMPLGMVKMEKGLLQKLEATLKGDQSQASGEVLVQYKDLKLTLLEKDKGKTDLDKKDVTTFLANAFVLKKESPQKGQEPQKENASFKRIPEAGFMMLVWKTMLVGVLKAIGAPESKAYSR